MHGETPDGERCWSQPRLTLMIKKPEARQLRKSHELVYSNGQHQPAGGGAAGHSRRPIDRPGYPSRTFAEKVSMQMTAFSLQVPLLQVFDQSAKKLDWLPSICGGIQRTAVPLIVRQGREEQSDMEGNKFSSHPAF